MSLADHVPRCEDLALKLPPKVPDAAAIERAKADLLARRGAAGTTARALFKELEEGFARYKDAVANHVRATSSSRCAVLDEQTRGRTAGRPSPAARPLLQARLGRLVYL